MLQQPLISQFRRLLNFSFESLILFLYSNVFHFDRFTSKKPFFKDSPISSIPPSISVRILNLNSVPVWVREVTKTPSYPLTGILSVKKEDRLLYSVGPWLAYSANPNQLSFDIPEVCKVLRPPKRGLAVALTEGISRIKGFRLSEALIYPI